MRPTRLSVLLLAFAVAGGASYLGLELAYPSLPPLPGTGPGLLFVLAVVEVAVAASVRARLAGRPGTRPILPIAVARMAALAKASSAVGAVAAGGYAAVVAYTAPHLSRPGPGHDLPVGVGGVVAAGLLVLAALFLERVCRVPKVPPGPEAGGPKSG